MYSIISRVRAYLNLRKGKTVLDVVKESNLGYSMVQMLTNPKFKAKLLTELDQKIKNNRRKVLTIKQENRLLQQYRVLLNKNG